MKSVLYFPSGLHLIVDETKLLYSASLESNTALLVTLDLYDVSIALNTLLARVIASPACNETVSGNKSINPIQ